MLGKVEICGVNTAKLKVLKEDEMMELMARSKQGDQEARNALVEGNLRLVLSVIQRFSGSGEMCIRDRHCGTYLRMRHHLFYFVGSLIGNLLIAAALAGIMLLFCES